LINLMVKHHFNGPIIGLLIVFKGPLAHCQFVKFLVMVNAIR